MARLFKKQLTEKEQLIIENKIGISLLKLFIATSPLVNPQDQQEGVWFQVYGVNFFNRTHSLVEGRAFIQNKEGFVLSDNQKIIKWDASRGLANAIDSQKEAFKKYFEDFCLDFLSE